MKRILSATMAALGNMTGLSALENRLLGPHSYRNTDPRAARHWHNPADPVQAARIEAAAAKRDRKADKLHDWACRCVHFNRAHKKSYAIPGGQFQLLTLNTFRILH